MPWDILSHPQARMRQVVPVAHDGPPAGVRGAIDSLSK